MVGEISGASLAWPAFSRALSRRAGLTTRMEALGPSRCPLGRRSSNAFVLMQPRKSRDARPTRSTASVARPEDGGEAHEPLVLPLLLREGRRRHGAPHPPPHGSAHAVETDRRGAAPEGHERRSRAPLSRHGGRCPRRIPRLPRGEPREHVPLVGLPRALVARRLDRMPGEGHAAAAVPRLRADARRVGDPGPRRSGRGHADRRGVLEVLASQLPHDATGRDPAGRQGASRQAHASSRGARGEVPLAGEAHHVDRRGARGRRGGAPRVGPRPRAPPPTLRPPGSRGALAEVGEREGRPPDLSPEGRQAHGEARHWAGARHPRGDPARGRMGVPGGCAGRREDTPTEELPEPPPRLFWFTARGTPSGSAPRRSFPRSARPFHRRSSDAHRVGPAARTDRRCR